MSISYCIEISLTSKSLKNKRDSLVRDIIGFGWVCPCEQRVESRVGLIRLVLGVGKAEIVESHNWDRKSELSKDIWTTESMPIITIKRHLSLYSCPHLSLSLSQLDAPKSQGIKWLHLPLHPYVLSSKLRY